ncbi:hypothetical protein C8E87_6525 [Paractinoplanes brasiliensis]|uniref:Uncharacterized protein n=1 Tax=Paractinoplanes brasiliensis TaxID=52695 RepID=A0A4R6J9L8_9ACTN|nr:hypothetical protein C8E87_6525 [Actinoplanes brasiliensis]
MLVGCLLGWPVPVRCLGWTVLVGRLLARPMPDLSALDRGRLTCRVLVVLVRAGRLLTEGALFRSAPVRCALFGGGLTGIGLRLFATARGLLAGPVFSGPLLVSRLAPGPLLGRSLPICTVLSARVVAGRVLAGHVLARCQVLRLLRARPLLAGELLGGLVLTRSLPAGSFRPTGLRLGRWPGTRPRLGGRLRVAGRLLLVRAVAEQLFDRPAKDTAPGFG